MRAPCGHQVVLGLLLTAILLPSSARAQSDGRFALGASLSAVQPIGGGKTNFGPDILWRIGHGKEGWNFKYGLGWFSTEVNGRVAGEHMTLGKLSVKPIMVGYGYTHVVSKRTKISANLLGGYAFTSLSLRTETESTYKARLGEPPTTDTSNTFVVKPELSMWYDLAPKVGLNMSVGYMFARPMVPMSLSLERQRVNADRFTVKLGIAYSVF